MIRASIFPDFKGFTTLLIWGSNADMFDLDQNLRDLQSKKISTIDIDGGVGQKSLKIQMVDGQSISLLEETNSRRAWSVSLDKLADIIYFVEPLLQAPGGHQYFEIDSELADEIMIAVNEYPEDFC